MNRRLVAASAAGALLVAAHAAAAVDWKNPRSVVAAALEISPVIRELKARAAAAGAHLKLAGALPNPTLSAGIENQPIDLSRDRTFTIYKIGASQLFIRGEKRALIREQAENDVHRFEAEEDTVRAEVQLDVLLAYDEAAGAQSEINANEEIARLAGTITNAARIRYETGTGPQLDLIQARMEEDYVTREMIEQRGRRDAGLARLRAFLNLPEDEVIPPFTLSHTGGHRQRPRVTADFTTRATFILEAEAVSAAKEIQLAKLERKPDLLLDASYGFRPSQKDFFSVMAHIELPIRRARLIEPRIEEATARRDAANARVEILRQQLRAELGAAIEKQEAVGREISVHAERLVPDAKLGFESALTSYQNGKTSLEPVLSSWRTYRRMNVDYYALLRTQLMAEDQVQALIYGARRSKPLSNMATGE